MHEEPENDVYSETALADMVEDDELSAQEEGFMLGYEAEEG